MKIKPCKTIHLGYLIWFISLVSLTLLICLPLSKTWMDVLWGSVTLISFMMIGVLVYIGTRLFYNTYLIVNEKGIEKYKGKKLLFRIPKENVVSLGHRKMSWFMALLVPIGFLCCDPLCNLLSFRYENANSHTERTFYSNVILNTLSEKEKTDGINEYIEYLTLKEITKISSLLQIQIEKVNIV